MIYRNFQDKKISALAFGAMRLPTFPETKEIDEEKVAEMVKVAIDSGVNYFDTAYPYHGGKSEVVMGKVLSKYPRESYYLATKYPGHQTAETYDVRAVFEEQLEKCGVDYFDFYLLHNVCENSLSVYEDERWGIIDYLKEQKKLGRIRHLGFSTHGQPDMIKYFADKYGSDMEFCQIQINYLDYTLQNAAEKYQILTDAGIPVWVMEPVRGGKLAKLDETSEKILKDFRPDDSIASWAFRWLMQFPNITTILSGMSDMEQILDNIKTFSTEKPLSDEENEAISAIAEKLKSAVPCTACRYCTDGCPMGLDIPTLIRAYNDQKFAPQFNVGMYVDSLPEDKRPDACISCGACTAVCPQKIDVPKVLSDLSERLAAQPKWADICKERAEAAKKLKAQK